MNSNPSDFSQFLTRTLLLLAKGKKLDNLRSWLKQLHLTQVTHDLSIQFVNFLDCIEIKVNQPTPLANASPIAPSHSRLTDRLEKLKPFLQETIDSTEPAVILEKYFRRFSCTTQHYVSPHIKIISDIIGLPVSSFPIKIKKGSDEHAFLLEIADVAAGCTDSEGVKVTLHAILYDLPSPASYYALMEAAVACPQVIFNKFMAIDFALDIANGEALNLILQLPLAVEIPEKTPEETSVCLLPEFGFLGMTILNSLETDFEFSKFLRDDLYYRWQSFFEGYEQLRLDENDQRPFPYPVHLFQSCLLSLSGTDESAISLVNFDFDRVHPDVTCVLAWLDIHYENITYNAVDEVFKYLDEAGESDSNPAIYIVMKYFNTEFKGITLPLFLFAILEAYEQYKPSQLLCSALTDHRWLLKKNAAYLEAKLIAKIVKLLPKDCDAKKNSLISQNNYFKIICKLDAALFNCIIPGPVKSSSEFVLPISSDADLKLIIPIISAILNSDGGLLILITENTKDHDESVKFLNRVYKELISRRFQDRCTIYSVPQENLVIHRPISVWDKDTSCIYIYCLRGHEPFEYQEILGKSHFYITKLNIDHDMELVELKSAKKDRYIERNFPLAGI